MRVVIDARPAISSGRTGVGHYAREMILRLPGADVGTSYVAWYLHARRLLKPWRWRRRFLPPRPNLAERWTPFPATLFEETSMRWEVPPLEWLGRFDVVFAPNFVPPPTRSRRLVLTVHDLAFRLFPETAPLATRRWLTRFDRYLRQAAEIIAVSEATLRDLLDLYPAVDRRRVTVIRHGIDLDRFRSAPPEAVERVRRRFGIEGPYLLFVGGIEPRKNLPALMRAWATLPADLRPALVIAGASVPWNPEGRNEVDRVLAGLPADVRDRVTLVGYVGDREKIPLYTGAEALVFPSLYEGFGFPVLEAMACGLPVLTSNRSSLPEVAGDAAVLVDPAEEEGIAQGIRRLLEGDALRERLRRAGKERVRSFSWDAAARRHVEVLHRAARW